MLLEMSPNWEAHIKQIIPLLDERQTRLVVGSAANLLGRGGITKVAEITGISSNTVSNGVKEFNQMQTDPEQSEEGLVNIRKSGGGRKKVEDNNEKILDDLKQLLDGYSYGNPESTIQWTSKSQRRLARELNNLGYKINKDTVGRLLELLGYSLQKNQKMLQVGEPHEDRDKQFKYIHHVTNIATDNQNPVTSIDCKKKEKVGNFSNDGEEYCPSGKPIKTIDHDFPIPELGKAVPYGVYDINANIGFVSIGISADTAEFSANSFLIWWIQLGEERYRDCEYIVITADCGGSNGYRNRLWKIQLQKISNTINKTLIVLHYPPGTSKWNKIEHRLFSYITKNWRGRPLVSIEAIVSLIANTRTQEGLYVECYVDYKEYMKGIKIEDKELEEINISRSSFHGEWNYAIAPSGQKNINFDELFPCNDIFDVNTTDDKKDEISKPLQEVK